MTTPKKKHLIELMIEAGIKWPEGAKYAAQDKDIMHVRFYEKGKPFRSSNVNYWDSFSGSMIRSVKLPELCSNWHQTIVTSEQYAKAVAAINNEQKPQYCASVTRQMPDNTIEQLAAEYHAKAAEACRLQYVADEALKDADDALFALEKAGELIGLVISIATKMKPVEQPTDPEQLIITDWRDLQIGDVVECVDYELDKEGVILEIAHDDEVQPIRVNRYQSGTTWPRSWRFIRRP